MSPIVSRPTCCGPWSVRPLRLRNALEKRAIAKGTTAYEERLDWEALKNVRAKLGP